MTGGGWNRGIFAARKIVPGQAPALHRWTAEQYEQLTASRWKHSSDESLTKVASSRGGFGGVEKQIVFPRKAQLLLKSPSARRWDSRNETR